MLLSSGGTNQKVKDRIFVCIVQLVEDQIPGSWALSWNAGFSKMLLLAIVFIFFSVAVIKYFDKKHSRGKRVYLGTVYHDWEAMQHVGQGMVADARSWLITFHHHTESQERENRGQISKSSFSECTSSIKCPLHIDSMTSQNSTPCWGPVVQLHETKGNISHLNHNSSHLQAMPRSQASVWLFQLWYLFYEKWWDGGWKKVILVSVCKALFNGTRLFLLLSLPVPSPSS